MTNAQNPNRNDARETVQDRPRVGVPYRTSKEEAAGDHTKHVEYCNAVREAGGEPVAVSLQLGDAELKQLAETLDAYVLPGSPADVNPALGTSGAASEVRRRGSCARADRLHLDRGCVRECETGAGDLLRRANFECEAGRTLYQC